MDRDLFFEPWLGRYYQPFDLDRFTADQPGVYPIHILGESHYGAPEEYDADFTKKVVRELGQAPSKGPFFRNLLDTLLLRKGTDQDYRMMWDWIGFSNFIQDMIEKPGIRPTAAEWSRANRALSELLSTYRPDVVLVLGQDNWNHIDKSAAFRLKSTALDDVTLDDAYVFETNSAGSRHWTIAAYIIHPSARGGAFDLRKARLRVRLLRQWQNNIDTRGRWIDFDAQRGRIAA